MYRNCVSLISHIDNVAEVYGEMVSGMRRR